MSKRTEDLAFKYNINASVDELSLFVSEIYDDGFHDGKAAQQVFNTKIALRDHFAGLAMPIIKCTNYDDIAQNAYMLADAMLKARERG